MMALALAWIALVLIGIGWLLMQIGAMYEAVWSSFWRCPKCQAVEQVTPQAYASQRGTHGIGVPHCQACGVAMGLECEPLGWFPS